MLKVIRWEDISHTKLKRRCNTLGILHFCEELSLHLFHNLREKTWRRYKTVTFWVGHSGLLSGKQNHRHVTEEPQNGLSPGLGSKHLKLHHWPFIRWLQAQLVSRLTSHSATLGTTFLPYKEEPGRRLRKSPLLIIAGWQQADHLGTCQKRNQILPVICVHV